MNVGITEMHGLAKEYSKYPPPGINYSEVFPVGHFTNHLITSTAKGVLNYFDGEGVDLLEAPIFPILTSKKWIYTPADFPTCLNFGLLGLPLPRSLRIGVFNRLILKDNFVKLIFKSHAGMRTFNIVDDRIARKVDVIYPAVRKVDDHKIKFNKEKVNILFVGDFLNKGGIHVVHAFEELQKSYNNIKLRICSSDKFKTKNYNLEKLYKDKIVNNKNIEFGYVERSDLLENVLPEADIFLCPTYKESYGYAIEEAMAFGIPVISTNHFAIPEIVENGKSGFLIDIDHLSFVSQMKDYYVNEVPESFCKYMDAKVYKYLKTLVEDSRLREEMGMAGLDIARTKFSFEKRNDLMMKVYNCAFD